MKPWIIGLLSLAAIACTHSNNSTETQVPAPTDNVVAADSMLYVSHEQVDSVPFIRLTMNAKAAYIALADSVIPSLADSAIALCVEAAFTGELLDDFMTSNIAGDYVTEGELHRGYKCQANTGLLYVDSASFAIAPLADYPAWIEKAQRNHGSLFQQMLIVHDSKNAYRGTPIKPSVPNIYRSACAMADGTFAVIQSLEPLPLGQYISALIALGATDALYLDMGRGWNYGWYRPTTTSAPTLLFDYRTPFQTNWLLIRSK